MFSVVLFLATIIYLEKKDEVEAVLDLSNYATKKELNDATGVDASNLAGKCKFITLKAEVEKLDINKLVHVATVLNNLKRKVHDLDAAKLKTVHVGLNWSDVFITEAIKKTGYNKLNTK